MIKNIIRFGVFISVFSISVFFMADKESSGMPVDETRNVFETRQFADVTYGDKTENGVTFQIDKDKDLNEDEFEYEGAVYRIISEKKHRVQLVKVRPLKYYDGKCYEQEAYVYKGDVKYSVYSIGYKAFSEDGLKAKVDVKLPSTVRILKSECMGVNISKLDLSETKVKTIPSYLFVSYEGTRNVTPAVYEIVLPQTCKKIAGYAFNKCDNIKKLIIPETVTKIGYYAIGKTCREIVFDGKVPGGMVYQKMKKTVIWVKEDYHVDTLELLIKQVSLGRCEIERISKDS